MDDIWKEEEEENFEYNKNFIKNIKQRRMWKTFSSIVSMLVSIFLPQKKCPFKETKNSWIATLSLSVF